MWVCVGVCLPPIWLAVPPCFVWRGLLPPFSPVAGPPPLAGPVCEPLVWPFRLVPPFAAAEARAPGRLLLALRVGCCPVLSALAVVGRQWLVVRCPVPACSQLGLGSVAASCCELSPCCTAGWLLLLLLPGSRASASSLQGVRVVAVSVASSVSVGPGWPGRLPRSGLP